MSNTLDADLELGAALLDELGESKLEVLAVAVGGSMDCAG